MTKADEVTQPILDFVRAHVNAHPEVAIVLTMKVGHQFVTFANAGCGCHQCTYNAMVSVTMQMGAQLQREAKTEGMH